MEYSFKTLDNRAVTLDSTYRMIDGKRFIEVEGELLQASREYELITLRCGKCSHPVPKKDVTSCSYCNDWKHLEALHAMGVYIRQENEQNQISQDIIRSKDESRYSYALGVALAEFVRRVHPSLRLFDIVTAPPSSDGRNHAELIARSFADSIRLSSRFELLVRKGSTKMKGHNKEDRKDIAQKEIHPANIKLRGESVILIDDVVTTGSTLNRCAQLLKEMGARSVIGLALARYALSFPIITTTRTRPQTITRELYPESETPILRQPPRLASKPGLIPKTRPILYELFCPVCGSTMNPNHINSIPCEVSDFFCMACGYSFNSETLGIKVRCVEHRNQQPKYYIACSKCGSGTYAVDGKDIIVDEGKSCQRTNHTITRLKCIKKGHVYASDLVGIRYGELIRDEIGWPLFRRRPRRRITNDQ